jgi:hypothetical protein
MSSQQVSRRSIARGAAWSVPIVAIGVAAPAFAASASSPVITTAAKSCKCPGGGSPWTFNLNVAITTPGADSYTIAITNFKVDEGSNPTQTGVTYLGPSTVVLPGGEGDPVLLRFRLTNSASTHTVSFTYTPTNTTTGETGAPVNVTVTDVQFDPCKDGDNYSCA